MLGYKAREFRPLTAVSLEDLVPEDNFYRQVERSIDLSFVHDLADKFYSSIGRPSVNLVVFFKLKLINEKRLEVLLSKMKSETEARFRYLRARDPWRQSAASDQMRVPGVSLLTSLL
jgi:hypothetical protein